MLATWHLFRRYQPVAPFQSIRPEGPIYFSHPHFSPASRPDLNGPEVALEGKGTPLVQWQALSFAMLTGVCSYPREEIVAVRKKTQRSQSCLADEVWTCARCGGVVLCMPWCESVNARVNYAHDAVRHPSHLSMGDRLILHALGVKWSARTAPPKRSKSRKEPSSVSAKSKVELIEGAIRTSELLESR